MNTTLSKKKALLLSFNPKYVHACKYIGAENYTFINNQCVEQIMESRKFKKVYFIFNFLSNNY